MPTAASSNCVNDFPFSPRPLRIRNAATGGAGAAF
jgi:hypothetical protein